MRLVIGMVKWGGSMSDLISRTALIEDMSKKMAIMQVSKDGLHPISMETVIDYIKDYPTVEAKPVVHGKWEANIEHTSGGNYLIGWMCSNCLCDIDTDNLYDSKPNYDFCPHCGCDMRGEKHD